MTTSVSFQATPEPLTTTATPLSSLVPKPRTVLGPLTTTFTPPSSCTNVVAQCPYSCSTGWLVSTPLAPVRSPTSSISSADRHKPASLHTQNSPTQAAQWTRPTVGRRPRRVYQHLRLPSTAGGFTVLGSSALQGIQAHVRP